MTILVGAIIVGVAILSFLAGFIMGCRFANAYLKANGLLLDEPKAAVVKDFGKDDPGHRS